MGVRFWYVIDDSHMWVSVMKSKIALEVMVRSDLRVLWI